MAIFVIMSKEKIIAKIEALRDEINEQKDAPNEDLLDIINAINKLEGDLKEICVRNAKFPLETYEKKWIAQSIQFAIDCIPEIHRVLIQYYTRASDLAFLDIGAGSGAGSNLIASLHADRMIYSKMAVDAIDYIDKRLLWARFQYPNVNYQVEDLFHLPSNNWDIVFCSHCLEHIENPRPFLNKIIDVCRGFAFVYIPYNEVDRIEGHAYTFTEEFFYPYKVLRTKVFHSLAWFADNPEIKVMLVTLDCR